MSQGNCSSCGLKEAVIIPTAKNLAATERYILAGREVPVPHLTEESEAYICRTPHCELRSEFKPDKEWQYKKWDKN